MSSPKGTKDLCCLVLLAQPETLISSIGPPISTGRPTTSARNPEALNLARPDILLEHDLLKLVRHRALAAEVNQLPVLKETEDQALIRPWITSARQSNFLWDVDVAVVATLPAPAVAVHDLQGFNVRQDNCPETTLRRLCLQH